MSPSCLMKPKQRAYQPASKSKNLKTKQTSNIKGSIPMTNTKQENDENIYIELDLKCSCSHSKINHNISPIQFSRRYLQCQSAMPIAILRSYIQQILPHSSMTQVSFYDSNDRLLQDSDFLRSLKSPSSSSSLHVPVRFTLLNTITSFTHCSCSFSSSSTSSSSSPSASSPPLSIERRTPSISPSPTIIKRETIDQTLSTCSLVHPTSTITPPSSSVYSPCLSSSSAPSELSSTSISIVNLLTPPTSSHSSFLIENLVESNGLLNDPSIIDEITSQFGEICPPLRKKSRNRVSKKMMSSNVPLDLSVKKRSSPSSSFDLFSSQPKWIKT